MSYSNYCIFFPFKDLKNRDRLIYLPDGSSIVPSQATVWFILGEEGIYISTVEEVVEGWSTEWNYIDDWRLSRER